MNKSSRAKAVQNVTLLGALVNTLLSAFQLSFGFIFHSNALVLDGIHSLSDLFTDIFVLVMTKIGRAEPDVNHPYGHGRFETMGVVVLGGALIALGILLGWQNIERLLGEEELATPQKWALIVPVVGIISKEFLYRHTMKVGKSLNAKILMANAWHHRSDALSSVVVLVGVGIATFGVPWMDSVAAIAVAIFIAKVGIDFVLDSIKELVDTALEPEFVENVMKEISAVEGVKGAHNLRSRKVGDTAIIDVNIEVSPKISVSEGHEIATRASKRVINNFDIIADVTAHTDIEHDHAEGDFFTTSLDARQLPLRNQVEASVFSIFQKEGLRQGIKKIQIHYIQNMLELEIIFFKSERERLEDERLKKNLKEELRKEPWIGKIEFLVEA